MEYTSIITISVTISRHPDFGNLKNAGNGVPVVEVCCKHGVAAQHSMSGERSVAAWMLSLIARVKELERINARFSK